MPAVLSSLSLFVSRCAFRTFGLAIVEAMAAGLLIVATRSEGALEIIEDRFSGKLVPADNPEALAEAIEDLLDNPIERSQLGRNAQLAARSVVYSPPDGDRHGAGLREVVTSHKKAKKVQDNKQSFW